MNHRSIIRIGIIVVIAIVILWSIFNISEYARKFHDSITVWSLGAALGLANALSVYAYVISSSNGSRVPAGIGIGLFGGMSAILQWLLYLSAGAPMLAAIAFGCFGPVAEAVLSWLHAALSEDAAKAEAEAAEQAEERRRREEERQQRKAQKEAATMRSSTMQSHNATSMQPMRTAEDAEITHISDRDKALQLHSEGYSPAEVAKMLNRNYQTVSSWIRRGSQLNGATNVHSV